MHNTVKRAFLLIFVVGIFTVGAVVLAFSFFKNSEEWATHRANAHLYSGGQISSAGTVYDCTGEILAQTKDSKRYYSTDSSIRKAVLHAVGDTEGFMSTGVHALFESELTGYNIVSGTYYLSKYGVGNDINLTLNAKVCKTAYNALNGRKGTVGVYNYKTGEIICMVSTPTYDPENKPDNETMNSDAYNISINFCRHHIHPVRFSRLLHQPVQLKTSLIFTQGHLIVTVNMRWVKQRLSVTASTGSRPLNRHLIIPATLLLLKFQ